MSKFIDFLISYFITSLFSFVFGVLGVLLVTVPLFFVLTYMSGIVGFVLIVAIICMIFPLGIVSIFLSIAGLITLVITIKDYFFGN